MVQGYSLTNNIDSNVMSQQFCQNLLVNNINALVYIPHQRILKDACLCNKHLHMKLGTAINFTTTSPQFVCKQTFVPQLKQQGQACSCNLDNGTLTHIKPGTEIESYETHNYCW